MNPSIVPNSAADRPGFKRTATTASLLAAALVLGSALILPERPAAAAKPGAAKPLARLSVAAPEASYVRRSVRGGIRTLHYANRRGVLATTQWPLILRFESRDAIGFVASATADSRKREALLLRDPDGCPNLASLVSDFMLPSFDPDCAGLPEDETWIEVQTEKFDTFELEDNRQTGNDFIQAILIDDPYLEGALLNTPYLELRRGRFNAVGPKTGEDVIDGYGFGPDDDFASLVLLANVGGSRVFDADFDLDPSVLRNMAGLVNTVSEELLDGKGQTAITASMHPLAGVFEPIAVFDFSVTNPDYSGYDYLERVDSGPLTAMTLNSNVPVETDPPTEANLFYDELLSTYYPVEIEIRAVVVAGEAPAYVYDLDGNGRFTARDVARAGYQLVTNEIAIELTLMHENLLVESQEIKCLPRTLLFDDLDGDGDTGEPFKCDGKSGSTRTRRVPR